MLMGTPTPNRLFLLVPLGQLSLSKSLKRAIFQPKVIVAGKIQWLTFLLLLFLSNSNLKAQYCYTNTNGWGAGYYLGANTIGCSSGAVYNYGYTGGMQTFTVPAGVSSVQIQAWGAAGGSGSQAGGYGAYEVGTFAVTPGEVLYIMVGGQGGSGNSGGGGGGTFVCTTNTGVSPNALIIAGGGGGGSYGGYTAGYNTGCSWENATTSTTGNGGVYGYGGDGEGNAGAGPNGGNYSTSYYTCQTGAGGGGLVGNGGTSPSCGGTSSTGGSSYQNGGAGGVASGPAGNGGYGGGGAGDWSYWTGGGGGGGYGGGGGGVYYGYGGGGGSYNAGTGASGSCYAESGNGYVTITTQAVQIGSTSEVQWDGMPGQTYSFNLAAGSGWTTPALQWYQYNGSSWVYQSEATNSMTITPNNGQYGYGAGWNLVVAFNGTSCQPAWTGTSATLTYRETSGPIPTGASTNNSCWVTNGSNQYSITVSGASSSNNTWGGSDGGNDYGLLALINLQGTNAGNYGGYFGWNYTQAELTALGYTLNQHPVSSGVGWVGQASGYGSSAITLNGATQSFSGYTNTVTFTVTPNTSFPQSNYTNAISVYTGDNCGQNAFGWVNYQVNFGSGYAAIASSTPSSPVCGEGTTTLTASGFQGTSWDWYTGANGTGNNLGQTNPLTVGGDQTYYAYATSYCSATAQAGPFTVSTTTTAPTISAPAAISTNNSPNNSGAAAETFGSPTVSDACNDASGNFNLASSSGPLSAVASNLKLWVKGDAGVVKDGSGNVSEWRDISGNGNKFYNGTYSQRPQRTASSSSFNGYPVVTFGTANEYLNLVNSLDGGANSNYTMFVIDRLNGGTNARLCTSASTNWLFGNWGAYEEQMYCNNWIYGAGASPATTTTPDALPHMYEVTSNSTTGNGTSFYDYGQLMGSGTAGSPNGPGQIGLGGTGCCGYSPAGEYSTGDVAEIIYYNTILTTAQRQIVEGYLAAKYNLPCPLASAQAYQTFAATTTEGFIAADQAANTATTTQTASLSTYPGPTVATPSPTCAGTNVTLTATGMSPAGYELTTGTNSSNYLLVGTSGSTSNVTIGTNWTLEGWVKFPLPANGNWNTMFRGINYHPIIVERTKGTTNGGLILGTYYGGFYPASTASAVNGSTIGGYASLTQGVDISTLSAGWHHIASTCNGSTQSFYVDGIFVGKSAAAVTNDNLVAVGNYQGGSQDMGTMDEVKVYNTALPQNAISNSMTQASTSSSDPYWNNLVAYYKMDAASTVPNSATGSAACSSCGGTVQASATTGSTATAFYTYSWSGPGSPSFSPAASTTSESVTITSPTTANSGNYTVTAAANGVNSASTTVPVVINPNATISLTSAAGTNAQTVCYNSAITNITYAVGGGGTGAGVTGLPSGINGSYSGGVFTISGSSTAAGTYNYTVTTTGSCTQTSASGTIVIRSNLTASQTGGSSPICYNSTPAAFTTTASGGTGSYSYLWYLNNSATGVTSSTYSPGNLTSTSTVYCAVTSGTCGTVNTTPYTVTVYSNFTASQSGGSSPLCYNTTPTAFTATGAGGTGSYTYLWYINSASSGVTTSTYSPGNLTASSTIYCAVTSGSCGTMNTTPYAVSVYANLTASQSGGSSPLCYNTAPGTFTVTAGGGTGSYTYSWYVNGSASGTTTSTYAPGNLTATSTIYCAVSSGSCGTVNSTGATITVYGNLTATQNTGSTPICYSTSPGTFTATAGGGTGTYSYQWYTGAGTISGATSSTYNPGNITASTTYYCAVTSGGCGTINTTASAITVYPALTATISGGTSPSCYNVSPGTFTTTATGGNGTYTYQWYNSSSSIGGATASTYTAPVLTSSNSYYCSVTSGAGCGTQVTSTTAITVEPPVTSYGSISASGGLTQTVCDNVAPNSGNPLVVSGAAGSSGLFTYQWYYQNGLVAAPSGSSTAGWTACTAALGTGYATNSFTAFGSSSNITFACFVIPASPVCGTGQWASNDVQVTVLTTGPQETASGEASVCLNGSVLLTSNLSVVIPATYQWYSSASAGFGSPTTISGATSTTYAPPTSTSGTLYYEIVATFSGSGCAPATSNTQTVTVYTVPTASQSGGVSPICYNTSPGTFTATALGGSGSFTYQWYNSGGSVSGATSSTFNPGNLIASDAFNCTVTDVAGCGVISTPATSITVDANLTATISGGTTPICYNTSPGTFTATAAGGTGTYTYQWFNGSGSVAGATSSTYTPGNLTASNSYFCAVTSGSCGTVNTPVKNITVHANLTANITGGTSPICYNTAPGTIRTIASGGSGTYTYQWYNSSGAIAGATASTYAPGNLVASDSYYCNVVGGTCGSVNTTTVPITVYANLTASISGGTTPICYNTSPGTFTVTGAGGNGTYTYQWYNGAGSIGGATASTYAPGNLTASDAYHASVTSGTCGTVATSSSPVSVDANLTATISGGTSPVCYNSSPGTFTATGSGGTGSYTYQWYNGGGSISGATASTYSPGNLTISDLYHASVTSGSCGTVSTTTTNIVVDGNLTASISGGNSPICYNTGPGTFTASGTGGTGSYTYQWYNSAGIVGGATASTFAPGNITSSDVYHCAVTSGGCGTVNTATTTISVYANVAGTISGGVSPVCYNSAPGTFTVTGTGGAGSYTYQWYNSAGSISGATANTYAPGNLTTTTTYHCVVTDASCGTANTSATTITVNANLAATVSGGTTPICYNTTPGTLTANGSGGTGSYTYLWYNSAGSISGATASTYAPGNLTVSDAFHCAVTSGSCGTVNSTPVVITVDAMLTAGVTGGISPICYNTSPGTLTAIGNGGTGSYTYQWYNTSGSISGATGSTFAPGNITASDAYYCAVTSGSCGNANSTSTSITVYDNFAAVATGGSTPLCYNTAPGTFTAVASGASGNYSYQWYNNLGSITGATSSTYAPGNLAGSDAYHCVVSDATCGNTSTNIISITVYNYLAVTLTGASANICYNTAPGTITANASGGTNTFTYQWYDLSGIINGATASTYAPGNLSASDAYTCSVTDAGCGSLLSFAANVNVNTLTSVSVSNTGPYIVGQNISLSALSAGATAYEWSGPLSYNANGQTVGITGATVAMAGNYTVTATTALGCTATATTTVVVTTSASYTWTGTTSTLWTDPSNWVPAAPIGGPDNCAIDVVIANTANSPVITSSVQVGNIQMDASSKLTLNAANISVCKDWVGGTGTQAVVTGSGIVVLNGSGAQTISGNTQMKELTLSNTAGATMQTGSALDIYTSLDLASGNFDATNGALTFKSRTVDSVGIIDNFSTGYTGTLTGNITAERYYAQSLTYDQHYMGSPVNAPSLTQFNASGTPGFVIDPWCDETRLVYNSPYGNVFSFHENHGATCGMVQWKVETSGAVQNGLGYSVVRAGTGTLVLNGAANLDQSYTVSGLTNSGWSNTTVQNHTENSGWQLVSNPYLATLNLSTIPAGFDGQVQVWNAEGQYAGSYQSYTIGTDAAIPPFQAFMVHKTSVGGTATFTLNASDRVRTIQTFFAQNANQLNIVATNVANGLLDQTTVAFNPAATDTFDADIDAAKFAGALNRHTIYTVNNNKWMSRNVLHDEATTSTVPMGFEPGANGTYKLTFNGLNTFDPTSYIYLEDKALNIMYNVRNGDYTFTADSADGWNRFVLHFTPAALITTTDASCTTSGTIDIQQPGTANWNYTLTDTGNAIITSGTLNQSQQVTVGVAAGTYTLTLIDTNSYTVTKTILVNGPEMVTAAFQATSQTVQTGQAVTLTASAGSAGSYQWNLGNGTDATGAVTTVTYTQPGAYTVSLVVTSQAGCIATQTQTITVNAANTTGFNNLSGVADLKIWSHSNMVYVDFTEQQLEDASVIIYDILGQEISNEKVVNNVIYRKEIDNIEAAYMIVMVRNNNEVTTKKVLITNIR